jgi:hypothetical protein
MSLVLDIATGHQHSCHSCHTDPHTWLMPATWTLCPGGATKTLLHAWEPLEPQVGSGTYWSTWVIGGGQPLHM